MSERILSSTEPSGHEKLLGELSSAAKRKMNSEEIFEQEVSYVYGNMSSGSKLTKDDVRQYLRARRGER